MLVLSRLMAPASKKRSYERKDQFIGQGEMEIEQVYRCLPFLAKEKENLEVYLNQQLSRKMDREHSHLTWCLRECRAGLKTEGK